MLGSTAKRSLVIGVAASVLLHALVGVLVHTAAPGQPALPQPDPMLLVDFDINEAPEAPQAELPPEESAEPAEPPAEEPVVVPPPEAKAEAEPPAEPPEPEDEVAVVADASVADAAALAENLAADAGVADAAALAEAGDAGSGDAGALAAVAQDAGQANADAGALAVGPPADAGAAPASAGTTAGDAGPGVPGTAPAGVPAGSSLGRAASANLLSHLPPGDVVAVMIRFDRLRGTPWAAQAEAILAPMPDHRTLIGSRTVSIADTFDMLAISTPRPEDVTATTLVGRTPLHGPAVRAFLDQPDARVTWSTTRGGPAGRRLPSRQVYGGDPRVFLMPFPGWVVLANPGYLGRLLEPVPGDIDQSIAASADLPEWLTRVRNIEDAVGDGPALAVTVEGFLPPVYKAPYVGELTTPRRLSLALEITPKGFLVRGVMLFDSPEQASAFITALRKAQSSLVGGRLGKVLLDRVHAYHALRGLSFEQDRTRVAYATSISVADARAMLYLVAQWSRDFFTGGARRATPRPAPAPAPGTAPAPAPGTAPAPAPTVPPEERSPAP